MTVQATKSMKQQSSYNPSDADLAMDLDYELIYDKNMLSDEEEDEEEEEEQHIDDTEKDEIIDDEDHHDDDDSDVDLNEDDESVSVDNDNDLAHIISDMSSTITSMFNNIVTDGDDVDEKQIFDNGDGNNKKVLNNNYQTTNNNSCEENINDTNSHVNSIIEMLVSCVVIPTDNVSDDDDINTTNKPEGDNDGHKIHTGTNNVEHLIKEQNSNLQASVCTKNNVENHHHHHLCHHEDIDDDDDDNDSTCAIARSEKKTVRSKVSFTADAAVTRKITIHPSSIISTTADTTEMITTASHNGFIHDDRDDHIRNTNTTEDTPHIHPSTVSSSSSSSTTTTTGNNTHIRRRKGTKRTNASATNTTTASSTSVAESTSTTAPTHHIPSPAHGITTYRTMYEKFIRKCIKIFTFVMDMNSNNTQHHHRHHGSSKSSSSSTSSKKEKKKLMRKMLILLVLLLILFTTLIFLMILLMSLSVMLMILMKTLINLHDVTGALITNTTPTLLSLSSKSSSSSWGWPMF